MLKYYGCFIYLFVFTSCFAQHNNRLHYSATKIESINPWFSSSNASGLIYGPKVLFSVITGGINYQTGKDRNVFDPHTSLMYFVNTESYQYYKKGVLTGKFTFSLSDRRKMRWCYLLNPYSSPFPFADSIVGNQKAEIYRLSGSYAYPINKKIACGVSLVYHTINNAKDQDVRNRNNLMNFILKPGFSYQFKTFRTGVNFEYRKYHEKIEAGVFGSGKLHDVFDFAGLWIYATKKLSSGSSIRREYIEHTLGGAIQFEIYRPFMRWFNELSIKQAEQIIYRNSIGTDLGGEAETMVYEYTGRIMYVPSDLQHTLRLSGKYSDRYGFENIQQSNVVNQVTQIIQYGRKRKNRLIYIDGDISYHLQRIKDAWKSVWDIQVGVHGYYKRDYYYYYPIYLKSDLFGLFAYGNIQKQFYMQRGSIDLHIGAKYYKGKGDPVEQYQYDESIPCPDLSNLPVLSSIRNEEYIYFSSDRVIGSLGIQYNYFVSIPKGQTIYWKWNGAWQQMVKSKMTSSLITQRRFETSFTMGLTF